MTFDSPAFQVVGTVLMSIVADHLAGTTVTVFGAHCCGEDVTWSNQKACSLIINPSSTVDPAGAVRVKMTFTLAFGATSVGSALAMLDVQFAWLAEPPDDFAKCMSRSTSLYPVETHVMLPQLVALTVNV